tara:strand:- start:630 stop:923 length:294 start_codon:yes stop_codon:yes gene_type:complete
MKKIFIAKIICLICIFSKTLISGDTEKIIQSNILGALSSLVMPAKASAVISLLPYISDTKIEEIENATGKKIVLKNKKDNSSVNYTNSINYINSFAE